jgi:MtN3 and saliva related transmembrane protein
LDLTEITGVAASIFTAGCLIPQLVKLVKEKNAENVSLGMMAVLFIGLVLWIWYGILKNDPIIIISNSFSLFINLIIVTLSIRYSNKKP